MEKGYKRGQVSVFVIAGILIVGVVGLFVLSRTGIIPNNSATKEINPDAFLKSCLEEKVEETTQMISMQGGYIDPDFYKNFTFEEEPERKISYLCYTNKNYETCTNQEPLLIPHLKQEIYDYLNNSDYDVSVQECFDELVLSLEDEGYVVDANYDDFSIGITPKKVTADISGKIILTKAGETTKHEDFKIIEASRMYDMAIVAQEIVSQESKYCHFDTSGFMLFYPQFKIDKFNTGDLSTIYTIEDRDSKEKFRFVTRSCVIPPGI